MVKYLFLDIDGVMNHTDWYEKVYAKKTDRTKYPLCAFDYDCVDRVNRILKETGAELVVSSSWRTERGLDEIFGMVGLPTKFKVTPTFKHDAGILSNFESREEEIKAFLKVHPADKWCALDDDFIDDEHALQTTEGPDVSSYLYLKNGGSGLTESIAEQAIEMLR